MNLGLRGADDCSSGQLRIRINTTFFSSLCLEFRLMCFHAFVCWDKKYRVMNFKLFVKVQTIVLELPCPDSLKVWALSVAKFDPDSLILAKVSSENSYRNNTPWANYSK